MGNILWIDSQSASLVEGPPIIIFAYGIVEEKFGNALRRGVLGFGQARRKEQQFSLVDNGDELRSLLPSELGPKLLWQDDRSMLDPHCHGHDPASPVQSAASARSSRPASARRSASSAARNSWMKGSIWPSRMPGRLL